MDSVSHVGHIEVQKEPKLVATEFEIGQKLRAMDRQHPLNAFDLNDEAIFNDEIDPVCCGQLHTFVHDRQMNLVLESEAGFRSVRRRSMRRKCSRALLRRGPCEREEPLR